MLWADISLSGAGSISFEQACMGLPARTLVVADNQRRNARCFEEYGASEHLGDLAAADPIGVADSISSLAENSERRLRMSQAGRELVDGRGGDRVALALLQAI